MYIQPISNNKTYQKQQTSFGGYIMLPEHIEKSMSKKNKAILEALRKGREGKVGDVRFWDTNNENRKCLFGAVDQWRDMVVLRAVSTYQEPKESSINFIKRMCSLADSVKDTDYTIDIKSTLIPSKQPQTSPNIFQRIWNKIVKRQSV